jgi:hypothetical protein
MVKPSVSGPFRKVLSFPRKREPKVRTLIWIPAFAGIQISALPHCSPRNGLTPKVEMPFSLSTGALREGLATDFG